MLRNRVASMVQLRRRTMSPILRKYALLRICQHVIKLAGAWQDHCMSLLADDLERAVRRPT